ncbi:MAG: hypothetical protein ACKVPY_01555 [Paracoccaceae bacterium]
MKKNNRWLKWVVAESARPGVALPWARVRKPAALHLPARNAPAPRLKVAFAS